MRATCKRGLIRHAAQTGLNVFLSIDKQIEFQQNLSTLPLPVIILDCVSNALPVLIPFAPVLLRLFNQPLDKRLYIVAADGTVIQVAQPRPKA